MRLLVLLYVLVFSVNCRDYTDIIIDEGIETSSSSHDEHVEPLEIEKALLGRIRLPIDFAQVKFHINPPVSFDPPTPEDIAITNVLEAAIDDSGFFESPEEVRNREQVVALLNEALSDFVKRVAIKKELPQEIVEGASGRMLPYGSFGLGVHGRDSDIDLCCLVPEYVTDKDFFSDFYIEISQRDDVKELVKITDTYVPIIKMRIRGVPVDMIFAKLLVNVIPPDLDMADMSVLNYLDDKSVRSLNGVRTTATVMRFIPNYSTYKTVVRSLKYWASRRGIYGSPIGYLTGGCLAIMSAKVCQMYPNAAASTIVSHFFELFSKWDWPTPVVLMEIVHLPGLPFKVWDPRRYKSDKRHKMPVVNPVYPAHNCNPNISRSTLFIILEEFKRAHVLLKESATGSPIWDALFAKTDFMSRYPHYIEILAVSESESEHLAWSGFLRARLRKLVQDLEKTANIIAALPYDGELDLIVQAESVQEVPSVLAQMTPECIEKCVDLKAMITDLPKKTYFTTTFYVAPVFSGVEFEKLFEDHMQSFLHFTDSFRELTSGMHVLTRHVAREDLPAYALSGKCKSLFSRR